MGWAGDIKNAERKVRAIRELKKSPKIAIETTYIFQCPACKNIHWHTDPGLIPHCSNSGNHLIRPMALIRKIQDDRCPRCMRGRLTIRQSIKYNKTFLGCSQYPNCTYTENLNREKKNHDKQ